jgi:hypothetical protein
LVRNLKQSGLLPEIRSQIAIGRGKSIEGGLHKVTHSLGRSSGLCEDILNTGELEDLLGGTGGDDAGTTGSGHKSHRDGTALAGHFGGDGVGGTDLVAPVASSDGDNGELGLDDGTTDGGGNFLRALDSETDVSVSITDNDEGLESGSLTGTGLLLDGHDLHDLILQFGAEEPIDDLVLFDGEREKVNLFELLDLSFLDETAQFGDWDPSAGLFFAFSAGSAGSTSSTSSSSVTTATSSSKSSSSSGGGLIG